MLPLKDNVQSEKIPFVNYALIALNVLAFFYELALGQGLNDFIYHFGLVPSWVTAGVYGPRYEILPFFTSMFLHGGWMHIIGNMLFLWIFGDNVEDRMGHFFYILFYLGSGIGASLLHIATAPDSIVPTVGASGAIAGVMGAYFVLYPRARVLTVVVIVFLIRMIELPAILFLGLWFLMQFVMGIATAASTGATGGIAFWAHVGGFLVGLAGGGIAKLISRGGGPKRPSKRPRVEVITKEGKRYWH